MPASNCVTLYCVLMEFISVWGLKVGRGTVIQMFFFFWMHSDAIHLSNTTEADLFNYKRGSPQTNMLYRPSKVISHALQPHIYYLNLSNYNI